MSKLKKDYEYPFNLAWEIFGGDARFKDLLPEYLKEIVDTELTERETKCIHLRFEDLKTYDEIAAEFNVTRERIRQILAKAIRKLRNPHRSSKYIAVSKYEYNKLQQENTILRLYLSEIEKGMNLTSNENPFVTFPFLATPIDELNLSVRTYNCLVRRAHFKCYGDFQNYKVSDFMKIRNLGRRSLDEILEKLDAIGFKICLGKDIYKIEDWNRDPYSDAVLVWGGDSNE